MKILETEHICKSFGQTEVLKDISFSLEESQVLSIIGSSGSGKNNAPALSELFRAPGQGNYPCQRLKPFFDAANPVTMQDAEIS